MRRAGAPGRPGGPAPARRLIAPCVGAALAAWGGATPALAQGTATVRVSLPVAEAVGVLEFSPVSTPFGELSIEEIAQGHADREGPLVSARTNQPFSIVLTSADFFTAPVEKGAEDLLVATDGVAFTPVGPEGVVLFTSPAGGVVNRALDYRWNVGFEMDPPGAYELALSLRVQGGWRGGSPTRFPGARLATGREEPDRSADLTGAALCTPAWR